MDLDNFPTRPTARDMMEMISPIYEKSYVAKWVFEVMSAPLSLAQQTVDDLKRQAFPETATWSLPYWEQSYGIVTNEALSLEERRGAIASKRNYRKPMNPARIEMMVEELCGRECELVENVEPHIFEIKLGPGDSSVSLKQIIDLINEVKQAQKSFRIVFDTQVSVRIRAEPRSVIFPHRTAGQHRRAGRYPDPAVIAALPSLQLQASTLAQGVTFPYPVTGTKPDISNLGEPEGGGVRAAVQGISAGVAYKVCGSKRM